MRFDDVSAGRKRPYVTAGTVVQDTVGDVTWGRELAMKLGASTAGACPETVADHDISLGKAWLYEGMPNVCGGIEWWKCTIESKSSVPSPPGEVDGVRVPYTSKNYR